jgi:hypothetical protein
VLAENAHPFKDPLDRMNKRFQFLVVLTKNPRPLEAQ